MSNWINFKELRANLDFELVLRHFGVEVKRKGNQHHGYCPLPNHNGKKNSPSFSAHLERGIFQCFGCGAKGNVLEFAGMMRKIDVGNGSALRDVALELQERFCPEIGNPDKPKNSLVKPEYATKPTITPAIINAPLDFELKGLDHNHPYLLGRGFSKETIAHFGLGFCSRGLLKDRVAIPLHSHKGQLIGYAGRVVDDSTISEETPRYRLPSKRERGNKVFEFRKTLFLYNGFRIGSPVDRLIAVESFTAVWWLYQHRIEAVVATMGADCSERQTELIMSLVKPSGEVWLMPDGDEAGQRFAQSVLLQVSPHRLVRWAKLTGNRQPTDLESGEIEKLLV